MTKITIQDVASFKSPVVLETDKKVNLIYGLNGTGKTTISNFLYHQNNLNGDIDFSNCKIEGIDNKKILVYNQNFISNNFYNKEDLKGIFTLSQENKKVEQAIDKAKQIKEEFTTKKEKLEQDLKHKKEDLDGKKESLKNFLWEAKKKYAVRGRALEFCLSGRQRRELIFNLMTDTNRPNIQPNKTIENLKEEAGAISDNAQRKNPLPKVNIDIGDIDIGDIENNNIFAKKIIGNKDSPVSALIKKLSNSDWVKQGLGYLPQADYEQCPFCQKKTITQQVAKNIKNYFDETYENDIQLIKELLERYNAIHLPKITQYENNDFVKENVDTFRNLYNQLKQEIDNNKDKIAQKLKEPSQKIKLSNTNNSIKNLNDFIDGINIKITEYNQKIDNKNQTKQNIKNTFWQIMRWDYDSKITQYEEDKKRLNDEIEGINTEIKNHGNKINDQNDIIKEQQGKTINIDEAINNINRGLNDLGIAGFSIKKHEEKYYRIVRDEHQNDNFKTLSEGEKMIISFLYFMELCKGRDNAQDTNTQDNKIIVIDDPISSLSHAYIFNISQLIKKVFFNEYKQVFVLTHSLYFFHELVGRGRDAKDKKLFRLTKSNTETQIIEMNENEIQNDYQAYWQVIKDHKAGKAGKASDGLLANSMRNILEHFFGFIDKAKLHEVIKQLDNNKFDSFKRYIDRESHSDLTNITDNKEIDAQLFKDAFKDVFYDSGYLEHYNKMIRE